MGLFRGILNAIGLKDMAAIAKAVGSHDPTMRYRSRGPGKKSLYTHWRKVGRNKYRPHQGDQEKARRRRQMGLA